MKKRKFLMKLNKKWSQKLRKNLKIPKINNTNLKSKLMKSNKKKMLLRRWNWMKRHRTQRIIVIFHLHMEITQRDKER